MYVLDNYNIVTNDTPFLTIAHIILVNKNISIIRETEKYSVFRII